MRSRIGVFSDGCEGEFERFYFDGGIVMDMLVEEAPRYLILRGQKEFGPYVAQTLWDGLSNGKLQAGDLVRSEQEPFWHLLGDLFLGPNSTLLRAVVARTSRVHRVLRPLARAIHGATTWFSAHAGWITLTGLTGALATGIFVDEPIAWEFLWLLVTLTSGMSMIIQRRFVAGIASCLASLIIPISIAADSVDDDGPPPAQIYTALARQPSKKVWARPERNHRRVTSQIPALALPQPVPREEP